MKQIENEIGQAMAVLDQDTGKLLNYCQLLQHPDPELCKAWRNFAVNEYGPLADRVGGRVKETRTIRFIRKQDLPKDRQKDVTYGQLVCTEQKKGREAAIMICLWTRFNQLHRGGSNPHCRNDSS